MGGKVTVECKKKFDTSTESCLDIVRVHKINGTKARAIMTFA